MQGCHAVIEAARLFLDLNAVHPHLVMCGVRDEQQLKREVARLEHLGVQHAVWREPDRGNEITAIATCPLYGAARKPMQRYKLLEGGKERGPP